MLISAFAFLTCNVQLHKRNSTRLYKKSVFFFPNKNSELFLSGISWISFSLEPQQRDRHIRMAGAGLGLTQQGSDHPDNQTRLTSSESRAQHLQGRFYARQSARMRALLNVFLWQEKYRAFSVMCPSYFVNRTVRRAHVPWIRSTHN